MGFVINDTLFYNFFKSIESKEVWIGEEEKRFAYNRK